MIVFLKFWSDYELIILGLQQLIHFTFEITLPLQNARVSEGVKFSFSYLTSTSVVQYSRHDVRACQRVLCKLGEEFNLGFFTH
jgi:hypothetical protein